VGDQYIHSSASSQVPPPKLLVLGRPWIWGKKPPDRERERSQAASPPNTTLFSLQIRYFAQYPQRGVFLFLFLFFVAERAKTLFLSLSLTLLGILHCLVPSSESHCLTSTHSGGLLFFFPVCLSGSLSNLLCFLFLCFRLFFFLSTQR
jgi:hypothetical protein